MSRITILQHMEMNLRRRDAAAELSRNGERCYSCGAPGEVGEPGKVESPERFLFVCRFPTTRFVHKTYGHLQVGDRVRRYIRFDSTESRPAAVVLAIERTKRLDDTHWLVIKLEIRNLSRIGRKKTIWVLPSSPVRVERPTPCGVLCCEFHRCERGDRAVYCADHWRLETAA